MKTKSILVVLFSTVLFLSCKNDKTESAKEESGKVGIESGFKVTLNVIVKQDDDFSLFFTEDGSIDFKGTPIWMGVKGSPNIQQVVYTLPTEVFPTELRLDFGMKQNQEDIILQSIIFEYKDNKKEIIGAALKNLFRADENKCTFDANTGVIKAITKDGVRQYPSLYPIEASLKLELEKLGK